MGYKLAGYDHVGGVEIDKKVAEIYRLNHNPEHLFVEDIREFNKQEELPQALFDLDILDGSPPCSSFSMTGKREADWGKKKKFREGQAEQRLDDLFFSFIELAERLQPKVVLAENVKGMLIGNAKAYVREIKERLARAGYSVQLFLLNAATMGVPQMRERVFFICSRSDLNLPKLQLSFNEPPVAFGTVSAQCDSSDEFTALSELYVKYWYEAKEGQTVGKFNANCKKMKRNAVAYTIGAQGGCNHCHYAYPRPLSKQEVSMCGSFPLDYRFSNLPWHYLIGMSVPPVMTAQIAHQIYEQWLKHL